MADLVCKVYITLEWHGFTMEIFNHSIIDPSSHPPRSPSRFRIQEE